MNLLVTGGCGFIGSHFINHYWHRFPVRVLVNIDAMYYCANETNVDEHIRTANKYVFIQGSVTDAELVKQVLATYAITHVVHFAARSHVDGSFNESLAYTVDNVLGTHVLLEHFRNYPTLMKFIHVSTDEVYGESLHDEAPKSENTSVLCPTNPYASTKAAAELIAQSYYRSFRFPVIITRCNNVYGPNQYPEKLIPRFIQLLKANKKCTIQGTGTQTRSFLHVADVVEAFSLILNQGDVGEIYNIGSNEEYTVMEIATRLIRLIHCTEDPEEWIEYVPDRPFNDQRYHISNSKLITLGWTPRISFTEGLASLVVG